MNHSNLTSETIRLETTPSSSSAMKDGERTNKTLQANVIATNQGFPKKSSFQITSIRPTSRSSNDGNDDSENDTEDTSDILDCSKVTNDYEQETPSYSEDYSRSDDLNLAPAPVIPTSSNYGIAALVQTTGADGIMTARLPQGVTVNVTEGGLALAQADGESDDVDNWQKRFKIVKIDSNEPIKRGRWVCLDFMDSPAINATGTTVDEGPSVDLVSNVIIPDGGIFNKPELNQNPALSNVSQQNASNALPQQNQYHGQIHSSQPTQQAMPSNVPHYPQSSGGQQTSSTVSQCYPIAGTPQTAARPPVHPGQIQGSTQPQVTKPVTQSTSIHSTHDVQQPVISSSTGANPQIIHQQAVPSQSVQQSQPIDQISTPQVHPSQQTVLPTQIPTHSASMLDQSQQSITQQQSALPSQTFTEQVIQPPANSQTIGVNPQTNNLQSTQNVSSHQIPRVPSNASSQPVQGLHQLPLQSSSQQIQVATSSVNISSVPNHAFSNASASVPNAPITTPADGPSNLIKTTSQLSMPSEITMSRVQQEPASTSADCTPTKPISLNPVESFAHSLVIGSDALGSAETPPSGAPPGSISNEDPESASTASTVAIDNKIEQAMDLVKSHLMFAVREEVEVLKERIVELMDRINVLEVENSVLRQYASPEALLQVQQQQQQQQQQAQHPTT